MIALEIILIVIGLFAVVLSFRISDYGSRDGMSLPQEEQRTGRDPAVSEEDREAWERRLEETAEDAVQTASDELARLSNEKLIGMDEYSGQVLEKIAKNHEEVVFLYNMLVEKEEDIKKLIHHADSVKAQMHQKIAGEYQKMAQVLKLLEKKKEKLEEGIREQNYHPEHPHQKEQKKLQEVYEKEIRAIEEAEEKEQAQYFPKAQPGKEKKAADGNPNHNNEIMDLYKKGHSVLEISRMLSLGQGEVKFVIDLHESRKEA